MPHANLTCRFKLQPLFPPDRKKFTFMQEEREDDNFGNLIRAKNRPMLGSKRFFPFPVAHGRLPRRFSPILKVLKLAASGHSPDSQFARNRNIRQANGLIADTIPDTTGSMEYAGLNELLRVQGQIEIGNDAARSFIAGVPPTAA